MRLSLGDLQREAAASGFPADALEKVLRLLGLLDALRSHPFLGPRIALKGGTALNLFVFDVPRLSVDIDLDYVGALDREVMLAERPQLEKAVHAVCGREDLAVRHVPSDHAGGKWRLTYEAASGRSGNLELDVNFLHRAPLWAIAPTDSRSLAGYRATRVPLLDLHDLAAGKLAALLSRTASRDVFDARHLLQRDDLDRARLRLGFVVHGAINRRDWRTVSVADVKLGAAELRSHLVPMLRAHAQPTIGETDAWGQRLVAECRDLLSVVLPLTSAEHEFLTRLNDDGRIEPELLTADPAQQAKLRAHPGLLWKAANVQRHRGGRDDWVG